jgi:Cu(I)/Ag(I) efflux system periplasmic protein CusF
MKTLFLILISSLALNCGSTQTNTKTANTNAPTPVPTASVPKDGDYTGKGLVTKVDEAAGTVEIDHEEIKDVMPPMKMIFNTKDKSILIGIKVGDRVEFVLEYKHPTEIIKSIKKTS